MIWSTFTMLCNNHRMGPYAGNLNQTELPIISLARQGYQLWCAERQSCWLGSLLWCSCKQKGSLARSEHWLQEALPCFSTSIWSPVLSVADSLSVNAMSLDRVGLPRSILQWWESLCPPWTIFPTGEITGLGVGLLVWGCASLGEGPCRQSETASLTLKSFSVSVVQGGASGSSPGSWDFLSSVLSMDSC